MASGFQRITIFGNLGQDPELKETGRGTPFLPLRVAVSENQKVGGEWQDVTIWFSAVVWGNRAEGLSRILEKGKSVLIHGRLQEREWEKDGVTRKSYEIVADEVVLGPRGGGSRSGGYDGPSQPQGDFGDDSDIPF